MRYASLFRCLVVAAVVMSVSSVASGQSVRLQQSVNAEVGRYRVEGAVGDDQDKALRNASAAALDFAAKALTGDPDQKTAAGKFVQSQIAKLIHLATPGGIFKRGFDSKGEKMSLGLMVDVNTAELQRLLVEASVITSSRELAKGVGTPTILVFYGQGDCDRGSADSPVCSLPKQIAEASARVGAAELKIMDFQKVVIDAGCLIATEAAVSASSASSEDSDSGGSYSASHADDSSVSARASGSASYGGGGASYQGSRSITGSSSSRSSAAGSYRSKQSRVAVSEFSARYIQASDNCRQFMKRFDALEADYVKNKGDQDRLLDQVEKIRVGLLESDIATTRINEWMVNQRWEVVDAAAVQKAQRQLDSMTSMEGLPSDPAAATAMMSGADVFIQHDFQEARTNGGYEVHLTIKAYDVVSGKLLASKADKSDLLPSPDKLNAVAQAVGRAMPKVLDQISAFWADMGKEGVKSKIVLRGNFSQTAFADDVDDLLESALAGELGRLCEERCEWEQKLLTKGTLVGEYLMPAAARKKISKALNKVFRKAGFGMNLVVSKPALNIMEVWF